MSRRRATSRSRASGSRILSTYSNAPTPAQARAPAPAPVVEQPAELQPPEQDDTVVLDTEEIQEKIIEQAENKDEMRDRLQRIKKSYERKAQEEMKRIQHEAEATKGCSIKALLWWIWYRGIDIFIVAVQVILFLFILGVFVGLFLTSHSFINLLAHHAGCRFGDDLGICYVLDLMLHLLRDGIPRIWQHFTNLVRPEVFSYVFEALKYIIGPLLMFGFQNLVLFNRGF